MGGRYRGRGGVRLVGLVAVGVGLVLACLSGISRAEAASSTSCPAFAGPKWTLTGKYALPGAATKRAGSQYLVLPTGLACPAALKLAKKVAGAPLAKRTPNVFVPMTGGPAGYKCQGKPDSNGHAYMGLCITASKKTYFYWTIELR